MLPRWLAFRLRSRTRRYFKVHGWRVPGSFRRQGTTVGPTWKAMLTKIQEHEHLRVTGRLDAETRHLLGRYRIRARVAVVLPGAFGVDVSNNNGHINWSAVSSNVKFVWAKVSEGTTFTDGEYRSNKAGAESRHIPVGGYYYAHIGKGPDDAVAQAKRFCDLMGYRAGMLRPVIDWEAAGADNPYNRRELVAAAVYIRRRLGVWPILYGGAYSFKGLAVDPKSALLNCPLWIAGYPDIPLIPYPWTRVAVHQYSDHAVNTGIPGGVDADRLILRAGSIT